MKKIAFLSALALCLGFTSCDNYEEPNPPAQSNPQETVLEANGLVFAQGTPADQVIDLAQINDEGKSVEVAKVEFKEEFPATYSLEVVMQVAKDDSFGRVAELATTINDGVITVSPDALEGAFVSVIGKNPAQATLYARYAAYAVKGDEKVRIGEGPESFFGPMSYTVLPFPSEVVIEEAYYILGTINDWSVANAIKFNHGAGSPYDNPVFTLNVDITEEQAAAGWWWKIIPESTFATGDWVDAPNSQFGVEENGDESLEGMLMAKTADFEPGAGCIQEAGQYLLTINLLDGTYAFTEFVPYLYTPGDSNGWSQPASQLLYTNDGAEYQGYVYLTGGFKFCNAPDWNHTNYGDAGEEGKLSDDGGAGNLSVAEAGLYWATANTAELTYSLTQVTTYGVIGDATEGGWDASTALTPSEDFLTWTGEIKFSGSGEFKFRANNGWDINLGGDLSDLTPGGDNIATPGDGTYVVTLMLNELPYQATVVKK